MAELDYFKQWYAWAIGTPIAAAAAFAWRYRREIKDAWMFWSGFRKRFEAMEARVASYPSGQVSSEARFCPACNKQMKVVDASRFDIWFYKCDTCSGESYKYPAPTLPRPPQTFPR